MSNAAYEKDPIDRCAIITGIFCRKNVGPMPKIACRRRSICLPKIACPAPSGKKIKSPPYT